LSNCRHKKIGISFLKVFRTGKSTGHVADLKGSWIVRDVARCGLLVTYVPGQNTASIFTYQAIQIQRTFLSCRIIAQDKCVNGTLLEVRKVKCTLVQALRLCTGRTAHRGSRDIALLFLGHVTRRGEGSASCSGRSLLPAKTRYPLYRRLGGLQDRSEQVRKISPQLRFDPRTVQPVANRYTDYAIRLTKMLELLHNSKRHFSLDSNPNRQNKYYSRSTRLTNIRIRTILQPLNTAH